MDDFDFLMTMTSDPETMKYIGDGSIWNESETKERLKRFISRYDTDEDMGLMLAIRKEDLVAIGHAGLVPQVIEGEQELEVGYWISREYWGHGYATESALGWLDHGFLNLNKQRLVSIIQFGNKASIQVAIKNGIQYEREVVFNNKNVALYSIER